LEIVESQFMIFIYFQEYVEANHLERRSVSWKKADRHSCPDFPRLTEEDLLKITLGVYQVNLAGQYTKEHLDEQANYDFFVHQEIPGLIRVKIRSRYCHSSSHLVWIKYDGLNNGWRSVKPGYCRFIIVISYRISCSPEFRKLLFKKTIQLFKSYNLIHKTKSTKPSTALLKNIKISILKYIL